MSLRIPSICFLVALGLPCMAIAQEAAKNSAKETAGAGSGAAKAKSKAVAREQTPLPTWKDTLIESDVMLLPAATQTSAAGYYPTRTDLAVLGDRNYPRSTTRNEMGPDAILQNASGIFPYQSGEANFYTRHADSFHGVNRMFGLFTPNQALTYEPDVYPGLAVSLDSNMGLGSIFTRTFDPSKAHVKAGPLAFDVLWVGGGAIWSDYRGPNNFPSDHGDGWVGYIELALRGYLRLTDSVYFSWAANLMYLPGSNELAFQTLNGAWPQLGLDFFYQKRVKAWDLYVGDQFYARPGVDIFSSVGIRGQDQAGRYMFGYYGRSNRTGFYDSDNVYFVNRLMAQATRMMGGTDWRFWATYQHFDFWRTFGFDNYRMRDSWEVAAAYEGSAIPFAPRLSYMLTTVDGYDSFINQLQLQFRGRITENVSLQTMIGYFWTSSIEPERDNLLWSVTLDHRFSQRGRHGIQVGEQYFTDSYSPASVLASYYRYYVAYQVMNRLNASAFAQYSEGDTISSASSSTVTARGDFQNYLIGGTLDLQVFDYTRLVGTMAYERADADQNGFRTDRWIYRLQILQQLASRLSFHCGYQYETFSGHPGFDEHMVNIGLRRYF